MSESGSSRHFSFILGQDYPMFCFASAVDVLRSANRMAAKTHYSWSIITHDGSSARSSTGLEFAADADVEHIPPSSVVFVLAGLTTEYPGKLRVIKALRTLSRKGVILGGISIGSYTLAEAGLLDGHRATIHWESRAAFREAFPHIDCTGSIYEIDRKRYTSAGGTTSVDMMLEFVREDLGTDVTNQVANQFQHERIRKHDDRQRVGQEPDLIGKSDKLRKVTETMAENIEDPLTASQLAKAVELSVRQVERLFMKHLNSTPGRYYMTLRLDRARQLLRQTNIPILEVALSTGFTSHSYFAQSYRQFFNRPPSEERRSEFS